jgi:hypothetical protein
LNSHAQLEWRRWSIISLWDYMNMRKQSKLLVYKQRRMKHVLLLKRRLPMATVIVLQPRYWIQMKEHVKMNLCVRLLRRH